MAAAGSRRTAAITLGLAAMAVAAVAAWGWRPLASEPGPAAAPAVPSHAALERSPVQPPPQLPPQPAAPTSEVPRPLATAPAPARPRVVLTGVAAAGPGRWLALVSVDGSRQAVRRVGDPLTRSATVVGIDHGSLTYRQADAEVRVPLQLAAAGAAAAPALAVATAAGPTRPEAAAQAPAPPRTSGGAAAGAGNAAFRQAVARRLQALSTGG